MSRPGFADRQHLLQWAERIDASSELPRLIRRLILETGRGLVQLGFPAGEGVRTGGWDGTVRTTEETPPFIPEGLSLWELSVARNCNSKAKRDFEKRTDTPDGTPTSGSTYVAVSLRPWTKRTETKKEWEQAGRWRGVRTLNVDDIETWLESAPVTHAWLSEQLGLDPYGFEPAESWWQSWSTATSPAMPPSLPLAGRKEAAEHLRSRLGGEPQVTTISGPSVSEVLAFISAALPDGTAERRQLLARTAFVNEPTAWRSLAMHPSPLVLVPLTDEIRAELPPDSPHHVIVPVTGTEDVDIELQAIDPREAAEVLQEAGLEDDVAGETGRLARSSLLAARRQFANKRELHTPPWADPPASRELRAALLAGRWRDGQEGDQQVLAALAGTDYEALREQLAQLAAFEDPPLDFVHGTWALVSGYDAWLLLRKHVRTDDLKRLETAVIDVLGEVDPALGMPKDERWKASLEGKVRGYSGDLRRGLATTLALLGLHGEDIDAGGGATGADWAAHLVRTLLAKANEDSTGQHWASLADVLSLLAEAAPDAFLEQIQRGLRGDTPVLASMFQDSDGDSGLFGPGSPHPWLLWALETVAWSPDHFGGAIAALARLAELDPGGGVSNRPINSLINIFCPWHPDNSVDVARRLAVFDRLRQRHHEVAWRLGLALLPESYGTHFPTSSPQFRDWKPAEVVVTRGEYFSFVSDLVTRLMEDAGDSPKRWADLFERMPDLPPEDRDRVRTKLARRIDDQELDADGTAALWESLRGLIARHRQFLDSDWALPESELGELDDLAHRLAPKDPRRQHAWLFAEHIPDLGDHRRRDDYKEYDALVADRRRNAVAEIEAAGGLDDVRALAKEAAVPRVVGVALADATGDKHKAAVLELIGPGHSPDIELALAFAARRFETEAWPWINEVLDTHGLTPVQRGRLLHSTRDFPAAWESAAEQGDDVEQAFWEDFQPWGLGAEFEPVDYCAEQLIKVGRNAGALHFLNLYMNRSEGDPNQRGELMITALDNLLQADEEEDPEIRGLSAHDFESIFEFLEAHQDDLGWQRIARLEWAFLPALGFQPKVPTLQRLLATDPGFFVQVISAVYRPREASADERKPPTEQQQRMAANGHRLLSNWSTIPGTRADRTIDETELRDWVIDALRRLDDAGRSEVGAQHIGHVLASAPADGDGVWPCTEVRAVIDDLEDDHLEQGFEIQIHNSRGVTSRGLDDGGDQERDLVETYREHADALKDRWPRTAAILRNVADSYAREARRNDEDAERFRRGLDR